MPKLTTITEMGVTVKVNQDAIDDQDLLELLEDAQAALYELEQLEDAGAPDDEVSAARATANRITTVSNRAVRKALFGNDWKRIKSELKGDDETLSAEKCAEFVNNVSEKVAALKN